MSFIAGQTRHCVMSVLRGGQWSWRRPGLRSSGEIVFGSVSKDLPGHAPVPVCIIMNSSITTCAMGRPAPSRRDIFARTSGTAQNVSITVDGRISRHHADIFCPECVAKGEKFLTHQGLMGEVYTLHFPERGRVLPPTATGTLNCGRSKHDVAYKAQRRFLGRVKFNSAVMPIPEKSQLHIRDIAVPSVGRYSVSFLGWPSSVPQAQTGWQSISDKPSFSLFSRRITSRTIWASIGSLACTSRDTVISCVTVCVTVAVVGSARDDAANVCLIFYAALERLVTLYDVGVDHIMHGT